MKKSELKEAIKAEIKSVLLEGMSDEEREQRIQHLKRTGAKEKPLRKLAAIGKKEDEEDQSQSSSLIGRMGDRSLKEALNPEVFRDVNRYIARTAKRYDYSEQDAVYAIMAALEQRKSDKKYEIPGFEGTRDALDSISIREEKETLDSVLKKIKDELEIYKTSKDTDKKKSAVEKLKDLNKKKKDLLNKEEEKIASIGKDQELDA